MGGIFWPDTASGFVALLVLDALGAAAAYATGRAFALSWSSLYGLVPAIVGLALGIRFLHYALFDEILLLDKGSLSPHYYLIDLAILAAAAAYGYGGTRAGQMATQYSWAYEKVGLGWRAR